MCISMVIEDNPSWSVLFVLVHAVDDGRTASPHTRRHAHIYTQCLVMLLVLAITYRGQHNVNNRGLAAATTTDP